MADLVYHPLNRHVMRLPIFEEDQDYAAFERVYKHPSQEAASASRHIEELRDSFDELLILPFRATNVEPYPFEWADANRTRQDYGSFLVRLSRHYE